jgi:hypothetical protein
VVNVEYFDNAGFLVDTVDDAVRATPGTVTPSERTEQWLANTPRPQCQGRFTELKNRRRDRFREALGNSPARRRLELDLVAFRVHAPP